MSSKDKYAKVYYENGRLVIDGTGVVIEVPKEENIINLSQKIILKGFYFKGTNKLKENPR